MLRLSFLASAAVSCMGNSCEGLDCLDGMPSVHLLQAQAGIKRKNIQSRARLQEILQPELQSILAKESNKTDFRCAPVGKIWDETGRYQTHGICGVTYPFPLHDPSKYHHGSTMEKELERPLAEIRQEHGTEDLFLHFGMLNDWINPFCAADLNKTSYNYFKTLMMTSQGSKYPDPVEMTFKWDGNEIHTRQDHVCQAADDPYCFANGWLKNQNALNPATLDDGAAYLRFAQEQCQHMQEQYHFDLGNITMLSHMQETNAMYEMADNACDLMPTKGALPTNRDFAKHAYVKCLMNNAATEIAYCYFRGCVLEGNRIGHGDECDY